MTTIEIIIEQQPDGRVSCTMQMPTKQSFLPAEIEMASTLGRWLTDKFIADHTKLPATDRAGSRLTVRTTSDFGGERHVQSAYDLYTQHYYRAPLAGDQAAQIKSAFFGGALSGLKLIKDASNLEKDASFAVLSAMESELVSYFKSKEE